MKIVYRVYQTRSFVEGEDWLTHFIAECERLEDAQHIAFEKTKEKSCEVKIEHVDIFSNGSERKIEYWKGTRTFNSWKK